MDLEIKIEKRGETAKTLLKRAIIDMKELDIHIYFLEKDNVLQVAENLSFSK